MPLYQELYSQKAPEIPIPSRAEDDLLSPPNDLNLTDSGEEAPLSASTAARLKEKWQGKKEVWRGHQLDDLEVVYWWVDRLLR